MRRPRCCASWKSWTVLTTTPSFSANQRRTSKAQKTPTKTYLHSNSLWRGLCKAHLHLLFHLEQIMAFDANTFLDSEISGATSTERILVEPGEYTAFVTDLKAASGISEKSGEPWARLDVVFEIEDEHQRERTGRARILMTYGVMLELDEQGEVAKGRGKNVKLGKLREALGKNDGILNPRELLSLYARVQ